MGARDIGRREFAHRRGRRPKDGGLRSRVVIAGRDRGRLAAGSDRRGGAVQTVAVDASDRDAVDAFFADAGLAVDHLVLSFSTGRAGHCLAHRYRRKPVSKLGG